MKLDNLDFASGKALLVDKPYSWTSFDVLRLLTKLTKAKMGHAGTLDPLATGLLIIATGKMTKMIDQFQAEDKVYTGEIKLGFTTPTFDLESDPIFKSETDAINNEAVAKAAIIYTGTIQQQPPAHSAIKINGTRSYELARVGIDSKLKTREVTIHEFRTEWNSEQSVVTFRVNCSKGTYIRSLANDLGEALGVGGYLKSLRRESIGRFSVADAYDMTTLIETIKTLKLEQSNSNEDN
ncbi:MAG: tRNA pseudouridine(55) synthase TruB [Bacteroidota bacterium]|nr:tRNA pseudouridine(55) synthase TruB [Bacteroidota bacterium]